MNTMFILLKCWCACRASPAARRLGTCDAWLPDACAPGVAAAMAATAAMRHVRHARVMRGRHVRATVAARLFGSPRADKRHGKCDTITS